MVESIEAETPAGEGAPALHLRTVYLHDENGNVVEERTPYGDEDGFTKVERDFGLLGELVEERKQILPDLDEFVVDQFEYDENLNVVAHIDGEGSRSKYGDPLGTYLQNLKAVITEVEAEEEARRKEQGKADKPKTEAEEDARIEERRKALEAKEQRILEETFRRTFGGWPAAQWTAFVRAYEKEL